MVVVPFLLRLNRYKNNVCYKVAFSLSLEIHYKPDVQGQILGEIRNLSVYDVALSVKANIIGLLVHGRGLVSFRVIKKRKMHG